MVLESQFDLLANAPHAPGVYVFKDATGTVIYVGKAKDLKKRVGSYFSGRAKDSKTQQLVENIRDVEYILVSNETEALILESNLIKKFKGKYNVDLKDSYRYPFVKITDEEFPRIVVVREPKKNLANESRVFGPFVDGSARHRMIDLVEKSFKLRTCKTLPKKACLKFYMGQCTAPCIGNVSEEGYDAQVQRAVDFFSGKRDELIVSLESEMKEFAKNRLFEQALERRDALGFLRGSSTEKQVVDTFKRRDQDFIAVAKTGKGVTILLLPFRRGTLLGKKVFSFESKLVESDIVEDFLLEYYASAQPPHEIVVDIAVAKKDEIEQVLSQAAGRAVEVRINPIGDARKMLAIAQKNLAHALNPTADPVVELKTRLFLPKLPVRIECFDISHQSGHETVGSMTVFERGKPNKSSYRRFEVRTTGGGDDYAAMKEVLSRRYSGSLRAELPLPDLLVVDGGKGQLSIALRVLKEIDLAIPTIGLAKRNEDVFVPFRQSAIALDRSSPALKVLIAIRDEAHRFANAYRKVKARKRIIK
jgi:excinuclease ABC subunit C